MTDLDQKAWAEAVRHVHDGNPLWIALADNALSTEGARALIAAYLAALPPSPAVVPSGAKEPFDVFGQEAIDAAMENERTAQQFRDDLVASPSPPALDGAGREGIYIASKTKHAERWRALRASGVPIISTWIDEAGEGESHDLRDLWRRCLSEAAGAAAIIVYREPDEVLKGGWIELGAAASHGVPVFAVGIEEFTIARHKGIEHFASFDAALAAAVCALKETP